MHKRAPLLRIILVIVLSFGLIGWATPEPLRVAAQPIGSGPQKQAAPAPPIRLRAATFVPSLGQEPTLPARFLSKGGPGTADNGRNRYLVQFRGPILSAWRAEVEAAGATILDYIPDYAYKVAADSATLSRLEQLPDVFWVGAFQPGYRLSPEVMVSSGRQMLRVELDGAPNQDLLASMRALEIVVIGQEGNTLLVEADAGSVSALSQMPQVQWISPFSLPRLHNDRATGQIRANLVWDLGYRGEGQTINIADTGLDTGGDSPLLTGDIHADVDNRVEHLSSVPISSVWYGLLSDPTADDGAADRDSGHGTHVAGSAAGNGAASNGLYRGVAPKAEMTFQALEQYCRFNLTGQALGYTDGYYLAGIPADLTTLYDQAYGWGARISSNSWGFSGPNVQGVYSIQSQQTDRFVWQHPDMSILFSVGNEARDTDGDGRADEGSVVPPATAKNIIAVGAVENERPELMPSTPYQNYGQFLGSSAFPVGPVRTDPMADAGIEGMAAFSGRGPALDGRYVPDVVAPGTWIASMRSSVARNPAGWNGGSLDGHYMYLGGSSMSTPLVAGAVALVRQAYMDRGHNPSAALLKATLIQTAVSVPGQYADPYNEAGPIPNNSEGWGVVDVQAAAGGGRTFVDETTALQTGMRAVYTYTLSASFQSAKFTLVWTDYPAAVEAARQLVNDLDLQVTTPNGQTYYGNVFQGGWSVPGGSPDRINNVECVYLPTSQAGTYTVTVRGFNVATPTGEPQNFALLVGTAAVATHQVMLPLMLANTSLLAPGEFYDDFSAANGVWPVASTPTYALEYVDGEYRVRVWPEKGQVGSLPSVEHVGDTLWEVDGRASSEVSQAYGLLFNYHETVTGTVDYDALLVSPTGYYALAHWHNGDPPLSDGWSTSPAILTGTATNHLAVRRLGSSIEGTINGTPVFSQSAPEFATGSRFGVIALNYGTAATDVSDTWFDNYHMLPLGSGSATQMQRSTGIHERVIEGNRQLPAPPGM